MCIVGVLLVILSIIITIHFTNKFIITTMLTEHKPEKENRSPSPKKGHLHKAHPKDHRLTADLPSQMQLFNREPENFAQELRGNEKEDKYLMGVLKARLADKQFEVRKLQEDFAQFKLLSRLQYEKSLKKLREEISSSKIKHQEEIKQWQNNFEELVQRSRKQCEDFRSKTEQHYRTFKQQELAELKIKYENKIRQLQEQLSLNQDRTNQLLLSLRSEYERTIEVLKKNQQRQLRQQAETLHGEIKKAQEVCQTTIMQVVQEKQVEIKQVQESKQATVKNSEKYLTQIGKLERERKQLQQQLEQQEMKYKVLEKRYEHQGQQMEQLKLQHTEEKSEYQSRMSNLRRQSEQTIESERIKIMKEHYEKTLSLQERLIDLEQARDAMISEWKQNQKTLELKFERRESRKEDIEAIREIQYKLAEKERETSQLYYHLRLVRLEKENNDKLYTKIFTSNREKRGLSNRNDRDIYSLLKQSHTTDFRHLLKVANKDSKEGKK